MKIVRFVSGKGFTKVASTKVTGAENVKLKNTLLSADALLNEGSVVLFNDSVPEFVLEFDGDTFAFTDLPASASQ